MRISRNSIGLAAILLGLVVGGLVLRRELDHGRVASARRRLEKAARDVLRETGRMRDRIEVPSLPSFSNFDDDGALARLIRRFRD